MRTNEDFGEQGNCGNSSTLRPEFARSADTRLTGVVTPRDLWQHVLIRSLLSGFITWVTMLPLAVIVANNELRNNSASIYDGFLESSSFKFPILTLIVGVGIPSLVTLIFLLLPVRTANSEFFELLDGYAPTAESTFGLIYRAVSRRETPVDKIVPRRVAPGPSLPISNYLQISKKKLEIWVVVMASGTDLLVGWTGWVRRTPISMPYTFLMQELNEAIGSGSAFRAKFSLNEMRAVQEMVHAAVLDGCSATLSGEAMTITQAFGYEIPVGFGGSNAPQLPIPVQVPMQTTHSYPGFVAPVPPSPTHVPLSAAHVSDQHVKDTGPPQERTVPPNPAPPPDPLTRRS